MLFRPKDRNYTSEEAERKANGYAMEYIIKIKGSIEDVVNVFKKTVTDAVSGLTEKVKSFENIMTEYFNNTDGKYHTDMEAKADKLEVSTELNKKADKAETYTKAEVEAMAEQTQDNIESYLAMNHYTSKEIDTLLEAKSNKDLSNIDDAVFKMKAENAGVVGMTDEQVSQIVQTIISTHFTNFYNRISNLEENKADKMSDAEFLAKINAVLPDGDGVSY